MKEPSKICNNHIVLLENQESLSKLNIKELSVGTGKYALVFGHKISITQMKAILLHNQG